MRATQIGVAPYGMAVLSNRAVFLLLWLLVAASRFLTLAPTVNDWDETLFAFGVNEYDVRQHHPHPPGYPLFIAAAKIANGVVHDEFRALQCVAMLAAMLLFPAVYLLARGLSQRESVAMAAAAITSFLPNVWYYGGAALSDVPALTLVLFASALLLRDGRAYVFGCVLAAATAGVRPHLLLIAAVPAIIGAVRMRRWRFVAWSWSLAAVLIALMYAGATYFSDDPPHGYLEALHTTREHVRTVDSIENPGRLPLAPLAKLALLEPFAGGRTAYVILALMAVAIALRPRVSMIIIAMFLPIALATWLFLDYQSIARYAVAYVPGYALLAAIGIGAVTERWRVLTAAVATIVVAMLIIWFYPALATAREPSPPAAALQYAREYVAGSIFLENELDLHAQWLLRGVPYTTVWEQSTLRDEDFAPGNVLLLEGSTQERDVMHFTRERKRLWRVARPRYFEISLIPTEKMFAYREGWFSHEGTPENWWRWMEPKSRMRVPAVSTPNGELRLTCWFPIDREPHPPTFTIFWNGAMIDRRTATKAEVALHYVLPSRRDANELRIEVDEWVNPAKAGVSADSRDLAMKLTHIEWTEVSTGRRETPGHRRETPGHRRETSAARLQ